MLHDPEQPGWTIDETLQLAGACLLAVAAHGPQRTPTEEQLEDWLHEPAERREAEFETLMHDLHATLDVVAQFTQMAYDGDYDEEYEAIVKCGVQAVNTNVEAKVVPVEGVKEDNG